MQRTPKYRRRWALLRGMLLLLLGAPPAAAQWEADVPVLSQDARLRVAMRSGQIWCSGLLRDWNAANLRLTIGQGIPDETISRDSIAALWVDIGPLDPTLAERRIGWGALGMLIGGGTVGAFLAARVPKAADNSLATREVLIAVVVFPVSILSYFVGYGLSAPPVTWVRRDDYAPAGPISAERVADIEATCRNFNR